MSLVIALLGLVAGECLAVHLLCGRYLSLYMANTQEMFAELIFFKTFKNLVLFALGLHCCSWAFSSCHEQGLLVFGVHGLLIEVASVVVEHGL